MSNEDDRDRQIAELRAEIEHLRAGNTAPSKVEVTGGPSPGGGFKVGFFGCFGVIAAIIAVVVGLAMLGQCTRQLGSLAPSSNTELSSSSAAGLPNSSAEAPATPSGNWTYTETSDPLTDAKTKVACTTSTNQVSLSMPYHDTDARLCLRQSPRNGLDAFIELNGDGQILCGMESCVVPIRFDKGAMQSFPAVGAADNSTDIIFINRTAGFVADLRKSSSTVAELTFFQNGSQPLTFNTAGLKW